MSETSPGKILRNEIEPVIPESCEMEDWRQVYFHYTKADCAVPVLFRGLWSVGFSHQSGVRQPIESSGFSPVQEEEGWEWISVYDADSEYMGLHRHEVQPHGENVTVVLRKLPFKTKKPTAERRRLGETLIKWRMAPRDIVALWVSESIVDQSLSEFVDRELSSEALERLYKQFNQLSKRDNRWRETMREASERASEEASKKYAGANWQIVGEIAKTNMTKMLIYAWIKQRYDIGLEDTVGKLLEKLEEDSGVKIFVVKKRDEIAKTIPLSDL